MDVQMIDLTIEAEPDIVEDETKAGIIKALKLCNFPGTITIDSSDDEECQQQMHASSSVNSVPACSRPIDPPVVRDQAPTPASTRASTSASTSDNIATQNASAVPINATVNAHTSEDGWEIYDEAIWLAMAAEDGWEIYDEATWGAGAADIEDDKASREGDKKELNVHAAAPPISSRLIDPPIVQDQPSTSRASTTNIFASPSASTISADFKAMQGTMQTITLVATTSEATTTDNFANTSEAAAVKRDEVEVNPRNVEAISNEVKKVSVDYTEHIEKLKRGLTFLVNKKLDAHDDGVVHSDRVDEVCCDILSLTFLS